MDVGAGFCMYDVVVKSSRSLSHLLISSCLFSLALLHCGTLACTVEKVEKSGTLELNRPNELCDASLV